MDEGSGCGDGSRPFHSVLVQIGDGAKMDAIRNIE